MTWNRDTSWRQGQTLSSAAADAVGLGLDGQHACAIVVSHDCDIAQDAANEPDVEIIVGRLLTESGGNYTHGKNSRRLHLPLTGGAHAVVLEINSNAKRIISKAVLDGKHPSSEIYPTPHERMILQRWLASRYRRSAFPDEFDSRMNKLRLRESMAKILEKTGDAISAVYFDVDQGQQNDKIEQKDTYKLSIYLLYNTNYDPKSAEQEALEASEKIYDAFKKKCCSDKGEWTQIELLECEAISDLSMSVRQCDDMMRWSADYISLRSDPPTAMRQDD